MKPFRLLHTSDWHLGRPLYGRRRYAEYERFLDWLLDTIVREEIDALLLAGDVFDVSAPSPAAQTLYYGFLGRVASCAKCGHVVVIAGNHDSPALLNAPGDLLKALNIHVVGTVSNDGEAEVIRLDDADGRPRLIVGAVPYPRDRDLRESAAGESPEDKERKLTLAIREHYRKVAEAARRAGEGQPGPVPVVAMGHLFAAGGLTVEGDGVRGLYIGSLGQVPADVFAPVFDYVALGHLHQPQIVGGDPTRRYSGAPLAMTFAEAGRPKSVTLVDLTENGPEISILEIPVFQRLERLSGNRAELEAAIEALKSENAEIWLELEYSGLEVWGNLRERLAEMVGGSPMEILRIRDRRDISASMAVREEAETLESLDVKEVFNRLLADRLVPLEQWPELEAAYGAIVARFLENDESNGGERRADT